MTKADRKISARADPHTKQQWQRRRWQDETHARLWNDGAVVLAARWPVDSGWVWGCEGVRACVSQFFESTLRIAASGYAPSEIAAHLLRTSYVLQYDYSYVRTMVRIFESSFPPRITNK